MRNYALPIVDRDIIPSPTSLGEVFEVSYMVYPGLSMREFHRHDKIHHLYLRRQTLPAEYKKTRAVKLSTQPMT